MNIKVCGITQFKQLQQLDALNIDFAGMIFYEKSPRYVVGKLQPEETINTDFDVKKTGVFVNPSLIDALDAIDNYGLDVVQLHGNESPELCDDLSTEVEVIKAFSLKGDENIDELIAEYDAVCDYYLFDCAGDAAGGNGKKFDWKIIAKAKIEKPFFISGGIDLDDIDAIRNFKHPDFFGVDINSRFEKEPGIKDMGKVLQFKQGLK